ncbi:hypothetical protein [Arsenophonus nasoniae]|uniref:hypothetical protein n=1 Tax=Arsenophonus nasoniae TaxID=638 RepID=UPI0038790E5A
MKGCKNSPSIKIFNGETVSKISYGKTVGHLNTAKRRQERRKMEAIRHQLLKSYSPTYHNAMESLINAKTLRLYARRAS